MTETAPNYGKRAHSITMDKSMDKFGLKFYYKDSESGHYENGTLFYDNTGRVTVAHQPDKETIPPNHPYRYIYNGNIYAHALKMHKSQKQADDNTSKAIVDTDVLRVMPIERSYSPSDSSHTICTTTTTSGGHSLKLANGLVNEKILEIKTNPDGTLKGIELDATKVDTIEDLNGIISIVFKQS